MESKDHLQRLDANRGYEHFSWWGDTLWSSDLLSRLNPVRARQSLAPPMFAGSENVERSDPNQGNDRRRCVFSPASPPSRRSKALLRAATAAGGSDRLKPELHTGYGEL
ncbi:MAG: hypothetical protein O2960_16770 [Verrucomicrobia bacterium]|nr:hypothetical protein [Verrucomicrobiota bacterium]